MPQRVAIAMWIRDPDDSRDAMIPLPKVIGREAGQRVLALKASEATRRPRGWQLLFGYEIQMTVEMR
jgi:hypothetical protein